MLSKSLKSLLPRKSQPVYVPGPPRNLNQARLPTVDRKIFEVNWNGTNQIEISLEDRVSSYKFPMILGRDGGKFVACYRDGGIVSFKSTAEGSPIELRVGSDKGLLYFSMKGETGTITTGLGSGEAAILSSLVAFADEKRIARACR